MRHICNSQTAIAEAYSTDDQMIGTDDLSGAPVDEFHDGLAGVGHDADDTNVLPSKQPRRSLTADMVAIATLCQLDRCAFQVIMDTARMKSG